MLAAGSSWKRKGSFIGVDRLIRKSKAQQPHNVSDFRCIRFCTFYAARGSAPVGGSMNVRVKFNQIIGTGHAAELLTKLGT